jgi:pSer/pThr/pTyr-binding forkhead associated (FHA) protein
MQVVLVMFRADGERRSFSIVREMTVVGRREDCDLRIPLGDVSRKHCRFIKEEEAFRVEDLGSSNGTFHNGQKVQEATLGAGDTVQIGPVTFLVQIDGKPADEELQPAVATSHNEELPELDAEELTEIGPEDADGTPDLEDFFGEGKPAEPEDGEPQFDLEEEPSEDQKA